MIFFGAQFAIGFALWILASLSFVVVHTALWSSQSGWRPPVGFLAAICLMSVPPFGIAGWANPVTAAGILFPRWEWLGILVMLILLCAMTTRRWKTAVTVVLGLSTWSALFWSPPGPPNGWAGINTHFHFDTNGHYGGYQQQLQTLAEVRDAAKRGAGVVLLPESAFGVWTSTTQRLWERALGDLEITVIGGAEIVDQRGYDSVLIEIAKSASGYTSSVLYRERMPVPVSMWQPWTHFLGGEEGAHAHIFGRSVAFVGDVGVVPLICYEQLIVWPVLASMWRRPGVIIAPSNGWWTVGTNIVAIQKASVQAWASLFGVPLITSVNM